MLLRNKGLRKAQNGMGETTTSSIFESAEPEMLQRSEAWDGGEMPLSEASLAGPIPLLLRFVYGPFTSVSSWNCHLCFRNSRFASFTSRKSKWTGGWEHAFQVETKAGVLKGWWLDPGSLRTLARFESTSHYIVPHGLPSIRVAEKVPGGVRETVTHTVGFGQQWGVLGHKCGRGRETWARDGQEAIFLESVRDLLEVLSAYLAQRMLKPM